jgi:heterodisulfide reductase subunit A
LGDRVAVIGGGNVAMDSVRTALRSGSSKPFHHLPPQRS